MHRNLWKCSRCARLFGSESFMRRGTLRRISTVKEAPARDIQPVPRGERFPSFTQFGAPPPGQSMQPFVPESMLPRKPQR
jgi:hypothetical protein